MQKVFVICGSTLQRHKHPASKAQTPFHIWHQHIAAATPSKLQPTLPGSSTLHLHPAAAPTPKLQNAHSHAHLAATPCSETPKRTQEPLTILDFSKAYCSRSLKKCGPSCLVFSWFTLQANETRSVSPLTESPSGFCKARTSWRPPNGVGATNKAPAAR